MKSARLTTIRSFTQKHPGARQFIAISLVVAGSSFIGLATLRISQAATFVAHGEAELGSVAGNAQIVSSAGASNGAVIFAPGAGDNQPGQTVSVTTYGAICNGTSDDRAALQRAFDSAPAGTAVQIPAGRTCAYNGLLQARTAGLYITGPGTLLATNITDSAIRVTATNVTIANITVNGTATVRDPLGRSTAAGIFIEGADSTTVRDVILQGSAAGQGLGTNGIFNDGGSGFTFDNVTVNNSKADCIHNTNGAHDGTITNAVVRNCGDDGVAVVSYKKDGKLCYNITIESPKMYGQTWGRGMTVVGGKDITYRNIYIEDSYGAAIYVGTEGNEWDTYAVDNIKYLGGTIVRANKAAPQLGHGAILVTNYMNPTVTNNNVVIQDMAIQNTDPDVGSQVSINGSPNTKIQFNNIAVTGGPINIFNPNGTPANQYNTIGWTFNGRPIALHTGFTP